LQNTELELICATSYLNFFLRRITEPCLLAVFLRFIFVETNDDGQSVVDALVHRLAGHKKLCQVTLSLFDVLVSLNNEDVLFWLVLRHLVPLRHLLPSQRGRVLRRADEHSVSAHSLLSLTPICTQEARHTPSPASFSQMLTALTSGGVATEEDQQDQQVDHLLRYLRDAKERVHAKREACAQWRHRYDGLDPQPGSLPSQPDSLLPTVVATTATDADEVATDAVAELPVEREPKQSSAKTETAVSSGYTSLIGLGGQGASPSPSPSGPVSLTAEEDREFWNLMSGGKVKRQTDEMSEGSLGATSEKSGGSSPLDRAVILAAQRALRRASVHALSEPATPPEADDVPDKAVNSLGGFLDFLLEKIELMPNSTLSTNLLATSILSQLASYPQPILRSALTMTDLRLQPGVRSLPVAVAALRSRLDNVMPTMMGADEAITAARKFLEGRVSSSEDGKTGPARTPRKLPLPSASVAATISQIGQEASRHRSSLSAALSSMFGRRRSSNAGSDVNSSPSNSAPQSLTSTELDAPNAETKRHAMAAVLLEEWLLELAAIAQEQSVADAEDATGL